MAIAQENVVFLMKMTFGVYKPNFFLVCTARVEFYTLHPNKAHLKPLQEPHTVLCRAGQLENEKRMKMVVNYHQLSEKFILGS